MVEDGTTDFSKRIIIPTANTHTISSDMPRYESWPSSLYVPEYQEAGKKAMMGGMESTIQPPFP